ncbi:MAG TPA: flagellar biosynthesis protein FlhA [Candidatus Binatia bacterium]|nr:flagellar biosynthesis protein FlhA [Candidatus Binatia bacterium]
MSGLTEPLAGARPSGGILGRSDFVLAAAVVAIVAMMIVPLPPFLLDVLIVLNITFSVTILLLTLNVREPVEFGAFPPLLLIATLFRLGLNVSASRLVLLEAHAGEVINAFGNVVVGGNTVVGIVVFLILVVIQYVVVTNGAGRVSEVAARFTLDAMPGKQMSIDADLNAGLITAEEARLRRRAIEREADFYGAMDGASKFVKGDAIAAMVIIVVNIVGGLTIGILQHGFELEQALRTYTVLTVGDGLVNEISALLVSVAAGILVTRGTSDHGLGTDLAQQLLARPRLFFVVGGVLAVVGIVPGFPTLIFGAAGLLVASVGWLIGGRSAGAAPAAATATAPTLPEPVAGPAAPSEAVVDSLRVEPLELAVGYGLVGLIDGSAANPTGGLVERIGLIRRQIAGDLGLIVPTVRVRDDLTLDPDAYTIHLRGAEIARGRVDPSRLLVMDPRGGELAVDGIPTTDPVFGLPAAWVSVADRERAEALGYTVVDAASVVATHLAETIRRHAGEILGRAETNRLLDLVRAEAPGIVEEVVPNILTVGEIERILAGLLREQIPIRDLVTILAAAADAARSTREPALIVEAVRHALARVISQRHRAADGSIHAVAVAPATDAKLAEAVVVGPGRISLELGPTESRSLLEAIAAAAKTLTEAGHPPLLLSRTRTRAALRTFVERQFPQLAVVAYEELVPSVPVVVHAQVEI